MANRAFALGKRCVLHAAPLPLFDVRVTAGTETPSCSDQESLVVAAMGIVATGALTRGHRCMDLGLAQRLLHSGVAGLAQGSWTVTQKRSKSSHVWVVAGRTFACCNWSVLDPCCQAFELMTAQAGLDLIDRVIGRQLRPARLGQEKHSSRPGGNGKTSNDARGWNQGAPPVEAGMSS